MSPTLGALFAISIKLVALALIVGILGILLLAFTGFKGKQPLNLARATPLTRLALMSVLLCILAVVVAFIGLMLAAGWWLCIRYVADLSPAKLALFSVLLGPAPLLFTVLSVAITRLTGGRVSAARAEVRLFGIDISGIVHTLFMAYMLVFITAGLAIIGLIVSGVWALIG